MFVAGGCALEGTLAAARAAGLTVTHLPVHMAHEQVFEEVSSALGYGSGIEFDGIVAASDLIAMSALRVLFENGHQVPAEVQVIGFDDLPGGVRGAVGHRFSRSLLMSPRPRQLFRLVV